MTLFFARLIVAVLCLSSSACCCCMPFGRGPNIPPPVIPPPPVVQPFPDPDDELRPMFDAVTINVDVDVQPDRRVMVRGQTNLPPDTELTVNVVREAPAGFQMNGKARVEVGGAFPAVSFGEGAGLPKGDYRVEVSMQPPRSQPVKVRKVIGEQGQHLRGPLVEKVGLGVTVKAKSKFTVE